MRSAAVCTCSESWPIAALLTSPSTDAELVPRRPDEGLARLGVGDVDRARRSSGVGVLARPAPSSSGVTVRANAATRTPCSSRSVDHGQPQSARGAGDQHDRGRRDGVRLRCSGDCRGVGVRHRSSGSPCRGSSRAGVIRRGTPYSGSRSSHQRPESRPHRAAGSAVPGAQDHLGHDHRARPGAPCGPVTCAHTTSGCGAAASPHHACGDLGSTDVDLVGVEPPGDQHPAVLDHAPRHRSRTAPSRPSPWYGEETTSSSSLDGEPWAARACRGPATRPGSRPVRRGPRSTHRPRRRRRSRRSAPVREQLAELVEHRLVDRLAAEGDLLPAAPRASSSPWVMIVWRQKVGVPEAAVDLVRRWRPPPSRPDRPGRRPPGPGPSDPQAERDHLPPGVGAGGVRAQPPVRCRSGRATVVSEPGVCPIRLGRPVDPEVSSQSRSASGARGRVAGVTPSPLDDV